MYRKFNSVLDRTEFWNSRAGILSVLLSTLTQVNGGEGVKASVRKGKGGVRPLQTQKRESGLGPFLNSDAAQKPNDIHVVSQWGCISDVYDPLP